MLKNKPEWKIVLVNLPDAHAALNTTLHQHRECKTFDFDGQTLSLFNSRFDPAKEYKNKVCVQLNKPDGSSGLVAQTTRTKICGLTE